MRKSPHHEKPLFSPMRRRSVLVSRVLTEAQPQKLLFFFSWINHITFNITYWTVVSTSLYHVWRMVHFSWQMCSAAEGASARSSPLHTAEKIRPGSPICTDLPWWNTEFTYRPPQNKASIILKWVTWTFWLLAASESYIRAIHLSVKRANALCLNKQYTLIKKHFITKKC